MRSSATRSCGLLAVLALVGIALAPAPARAAQFYYNAILSGANESPPVASSGYGTAEVDIDDAANTMRVRVTFANLTGSTTACHIHAPTTNAYTGIAGVATPTPTFPNFPLGVIAGQYDQTFDMTLTSSYSSTFLSNNGGTAASAEAALFSDIAAGKAYLNVHSTVFPAGEIRGFLYPFDPTPTRNTTWGAVKSLYR